VLQTDWNPAVDKQAAARCWRDGQKKRCFTYRFLATGTVEEKIFQRQLSKEGLQSVVDDKEQVNTLSTKDLRNLFKLRTDTPSDTHDKLRCERCTTIDDDAEVEALKTLPAKLAACRHLLEKLSQCDDASFFLAPLLPQDYGVTKEEYERLVKQPIDLGTVRSRLDLPIDHSTAYKSISGFSKDVNRIFTNVMKVWSPGDEIADAARRLQSWWIEQWTQLVPDLMTMKTSGEANQGWNGTMHDDAVESCAHVCNERKEDYQEQIGMPDEENMRSWSHHYKAETVDDPVFRAAMKGFDAVSFVFGLEVTWSLIQQRRQEEEERKAMLELECFEGSEVDHAQDCSRCEIVDEGAELLTTDNGCNVAANDGEAEFSMGDGGAEGGDDDEEVSNGGEGDDTGSDEEAEFSMGGEGDDTGSDEEEEFSIGEQENGGGFEAIVGNAETFGIKSIASPLLEKLTDASMNRSPSHRMQSPNQKAKTSEDEKENSSSSQAWPCPACTLHNHISARKCEVCGTKKPAPSSGRKRKRLEAAS
jgi:hypothetical protein